MSAAIWWIRRDLRLNDNPALVSALEYAGEIIPLFIVDPHLLGSPYSAPRRVEFLFQGLSTLERNLKNSGSYLILREGPPHEVLSSLFRDYEINAIFAEPDYSSYSRKRDTRIEKDFPVHWIESPLVITPGSLLSASHTPYTVFTPFSRAWKSLLASRAIQLQNAPGFVPTSPNVPTLPIPPSSPDHDFLPDAGEETANTRLDYFTNGADAPIYTYQENRNRLDRAGTAQISSYLRFGMISARQAVAAAYRAMQISPCPVAQKSAECWLNELIWREFYYHILNHFPFVQKSNLRKIDISWINDRTQFQAWRQGETGYPIVDAGMRQLVTEGWLHNRERMIVASFLIKDLLIDWRWGEKWFMKNLIDGDPAANNGGWQWTAGTGADAAPYFRIFNPILQGKRHDPNGIFVRKWLPELANVSDAFIHEPWKMPLFIQQASGCIIGRDYPAPIIDHSFARERALHAYGKIQ